jgi:hypothetical protein
MVTGTFANDLGAVPQSTISDITLSGVALDVTNYPMTGGLEFVDNFFDPITNTHL